MNACSWPTCTPDSLMWRRDLLRRNWAGHVDVPRMLEGGLAFEVFTATTKVPVGANLYRTARRLGHDHAAAVRVPALAPAHLA